MREERITIRLDDALLQRLEELRREVEPLPGEKRRDGKVALSTLVRRAVEAYLDREEAK